MKKIQFLLVLLIAPLIQSSVVRHDYYVSVTNIEYEESQASVQIITQVFIDDFEKLLKERYDQDIILAPDNKSDLIDKYIGRYLNDRLEVNLNGNTTKFNFLGKEYKDDITYCYLEIEEVSEITSIEVINKILFDIYNEQQNIVRLKLLGKNKSFLLVPDNDKCMLNFN